MAAKPRNVKSRVKKRATKRVGAATTRTPAKSVKADAVDAHERGKDWLTESEVEQLRLSARRGRWGTRDDVLILLMYRHGLRVTEAIRLRKDQINLKEARIDVRRMKGGLDVQQPLAGDELRAIKAYLRTRDDHLPWLFLSERGAPLTRQAVNYLLRVAGEQAKLGHVHPHMLRHGCGYYLANNGHDTRLIQDYLGHRSADHTVRYTRTAARRFEGLWKK
jgi:type 1 fimbriae regulatory protein FimB